MSPFLSGKEKYLPLSTVDEELASHKLKGNVPRSNSLASSLTASSRSPKRVLYLCLACISCYALFKLPTDSSTPPVVPIGGAAQAEFQSYFKPHTPFREHEVKDSWVPFLPSAAPPLLPALPPNTAESTVPERVFSAACADQFISQGEVCDLTSSERDILREQSKLSVIWTFENGSDPILSQTRDDFLSLQPINERGRASRHFRTHQELLHSLRSVLRAFQDGLQDSLSSFHLLTTDLPDDLDFDSGSNSKAASFSNQKHARWGLKPSWLNTEWLSHGSIHFFLEFPWRVFQTRNMAPAEAQRWRSEALPTFQSMSVESQIPNIQTHNDLVLGLCDDYFFMKELSLADVATPLFGPVYHLQNHLLVKPAGPHDFEKGGKEVDGEWGSLGYAAQLLDGRFGLKKRPYPTHHFKSFNMPVLREAMQAFDVPFRETGLARFRGHGDSVEVNLAFVAINWTIERAREALLWSFIVGKTDTNRDGLIDLSERESLFRFAELASVELETTEDFIKVGRPFRKSDYFNPSLQQAGLPPPKETDMFLSFASHGYPYLSQRKDSEYAYQYYDQWNGGGWADFSQPPTNETYCELVETCFDIEGETTPSADRLFKQIAFERPECGNCLMSALLKISGHKGFEAFLPPASPLIGDSAETSAPQTSRVLPITRTWEEADFSLRSVLPRDTDLRQFCVRLLQRYPWAVGEISTSFIKMTRPRETQFKLDALASFDEHPRPGAQKIALLALNDDIKTDAYSAKIDETLMRFYNRHFPNRADWELAQ